jgi:hypothetical protein
MTDIDGKNDALHKADSVITILLGDRSMVGQRTLTP